MRPSEIKYKNSKRSEAKSIKKTIHEEEIQIETELKIIENFIKVVEMENMVSILKMLF